MGFEPSTKKKILIKATFRVKKGGTRTRHLRKKVCLKWDLNPRILR